MDIDKIWKDYAEQRGILDRYDKTFLATLKGVFISGATKAIEETRVIFVDNSLSCATLSQEKAEEKFKDYKTIPLL